MQRLLLLLLKAGVSILLLYLSLRSVHLDAVGERLGRINIGWLLTAALLATFQVALDRKSTRLNSSHIQKSRMPSSA